MPRPHCIWGLLGCQKGESRSPPTVDRGGRGGRGGVCTTPPGPQPHGDPGGGGRRGRERSRAIRPSHRKDDHQQQRFLPGAAPSREYLCTRQRGTTSGSTVWPTTASTVEKFGWGSARAHAVRSVRLHGGTREHADVAEVSRLLEDRDHDRRPPARGGQELLRRRWPAQHRRAHAFPQRTVTPTCSWCTNRACTAPAPTVRAVDCRYGAPCHTCSSCSRSTCRRGADRRGVHTWGAQIDRHGNLNTTVIGDYANPKEPCSGARTRRDRDPRRSRSWTCAGAAFVRRAPGLPTFAGGRSSHDAARGWHGSGPTGVVTDLRVRRRYGGDDLDHPASRRDAGRRPGQHGVEHGQFGRDTPAHTGGAPPDPRGARSPGGLHQVAMDIGAGTSRTRHTSRSSMTSWFAPLLAPDPAARLLQRLRAMAGGNGARPAGCCGSLPAVLAECLISDERPACPRPNRSPRRAQRACAWIHPHVDRGGPSARHTPSLVDAAFGSEREPIEREVESPISRGAGLASPSDGDRRGPPASGRRGIRGTRHPPPSVAGARGSRPRACVRFADGGEAAHRGLRAR